MAKKHFFGLFLTSFVHFVPFRGLESTKTGHSENQKPEKIKKFYLHSRPRFTPTRPQKSTPFFVTKVQIRAFIEGLLFFQSARIPACSSLCPAKPWRSMGQGYILRALVSSWQKT